MTLGTCRGVKECAISRFPAVPKAPPERLSNPAITHKRAVFASPGSRVTNPPTEILTLQVKCRLYGEAWDIRGLWRDRRCTIWRRLSEGKCKTFCRTKASRICRGTHPAFFQCKLMALSPRVKRPEWEAEHSSGSCGYWECMELYLHVLPCVYGMELKELQGSSMLTLRRGVRIYVEVIISCITP
jgi:hypothetical protein